MKKKLSVRAGQRMENLNKAYSQLLHAVTMPEYSELEIAGLTQTFEFTFELLWKLLKDICEQEGFMLSSPKEVIRQAGVIGITHQVAELLEALDKRNILSHTYQSLVAQEAVTLIKEIYEPAIAKTIHQISEIYEA